jgi:hypothetical protein
MSNMASCQSPVPVRTGASSGAIGTTSTSGGRRLDVTVSVIQSRWTPSCSKTRHGEARVVVDDVEPSTVRTGLVDRVVRRASPAAHAAAASAAHEPLLEALQVVAMAFG